MNDTEETARRLFAVATEDIPPGIDLLRGVQSRKRVVRVRSLVAVGAAGIVALAAAITLSAVPAPSAFAQVKQAVARMAATSYQVRSAQKILRVGGLRSKPWATAYGEFDLTRGVGEQTDNPGRGGDADGTRHSELLLGHAVGVRPAGPAGPAAVGHRCPRGRPGVRARLDGLGVRVHRRQEPGRALAHAL